VEAMKRSRFTEEQILLALKQVAAGQPVAYDEFFEKWTNVKSTG
jgi:hypothetical protein